MRKRGLGSLCACVCECLCLGCLWITERSASAVEPLLDREHVIGVKNVVFGPQYINLMAHTAKSAFQQKENMKNVLIYKKHLAHWAVRASTMTIIRLQLDGSCRVVMQIKEKYCFPRGRCFYLSRLRQVAISFSLFFPYNISVCSYLFVVVFLSQWIRREITAGSVVCVYHLSWF